MSRDEELGAARPPRRGSRRARARRRRRRARRSSARSSPSGACRRAPARRAARARREQPRRLSSSAGAAGRASRAPGCSRPSKLPALGHPEVRDRLVGELVAERPRGPRPASRRRTCPRRPRSRRRARRRSRPPPGAARAAPSRASRVAHALEQRLAGDLPGVQVRAGEQRVVVEHLLEVRDEPARVDASSARSRRRPGRTCRRWPSGAACAAPSRARRGRAGTRSRTRAGTSARRPSRRARRRSARAAPATAASSDARVDLLLRRLQRGRAAAAAATIAARPARGSPRAARPTRAPTPVSTCASSACPGAARAGSRCRRRTARRRGVRKAFSGQPPCPVIACTRVHVDRVDVRALLAVDLDADEALVHQRRDLRVLEGLALHHVAPVAGRVADRDEQRAVLLARAARAPPRPTGTSPRGSRRAGAGRGRSRWRGGWPRSRFAFHVPSSRNGHGLGAPDAVGPYSHAVKSGGLLFCSGQIPLDPEHRRARRAARSASRRGAAWRTSPSSPPPRGAQLAGRRAADGST